MGSRPWVTEFELARLAIMAQNQSAMAELGLDNLAPQRGREVEILSRAFKIPGNGPKYPDPSVLPAE